MVTNRDIDVLCQIVEIYVREGVPVSSLRVKETTGMSVSTATIRNVMVRLEEAGFLAKPHTSAGRVPTDAGYRVYVNQLDATVRYGDAFSSRLRDEMGERADVHEVMAAASRALGALTRNLALVYGAMVQESRVKNVRLIRLDDERLLVVVMLAPENERTATLRLDHAVPADVLVRTENRIHDAIIGKMVGEAREVLDESIRDNVTDEGIISREIAERRDELFSEPPAVELYFEEREHGLEQPEFADPRILQLLLGLLHNKQYVTQILAGRLRDQTQITIGQEHLDRELRPFSLVTAGYRMGSARGVLGVIGPTRMRYDLVRSLVGGAAKELRAIGEEFF